MSYFTKLEKKQKYFALIFLIGIFIKYNYLLIYIFQIPSVIGLILKNIVILILLVVYVLPFVRSKYGREVLFWILFIFTLFFISNLWYNRYFGNYLSLSDMMMGRGFRPFKVLVFQLISLSDILFALDVVILAYYRYNIKESINYKNIFFKNETKKRFLAGILIVILLIFQIFYTNILLGKQNPLTLYNKSSSAFVNVYGVIPLYIYEYYHLSNLDLDNINQDEIKPPVERELSGDQIINQINNIIVIQVESLDKKIFNLSYNNREITPFLNGLKEQALYFDNIYAQHSNGSFDAEFSFLTSIYPINKNYGFKINDLSRFESLVKILKEKGYYTVAFHGNDKTFFHRHKAFPELGFDQFYSREDFSFEDTVIDVNKTIFGINDYDFFLQSSNYLKDINQPFFAFFITVTSHTPFDFYPADQSIEDFNTIDNPFVKDYFNSIAFVDKSLKMFFDKLKQMGLYEDTLFIIYSDHDAGIDKAEYKSGREFILNKSLKHPENIPLLIIHPDIKSGTIKKEGTTTDLAPTVLDILGEEKKPEEFLGNSLLENEKQPVFFMQEIPQILFENQLFIYQQTGIEKIGYVKGKDNQSIRLPNKEEIIMMIDYIKNIILKRRVEN